MTKVEKTLERILRGASDASIPFADLCSVLSVLGFEQRIRGDHHVFTKHGIVEIVNLQPKGSHAKPYQVKQVRNIILRYRLAGENND